MKITDEIAVKMQETLYGVVDLLCSEDEARIIAEAVAPLIAQEAAQEIEPTLEMLAAGKDSLYSCSEDPTTEDARKCWQAMSAVAPLIAQEAAQEIAALRAALGEAANTLTVLNRLGGLGYDKHGWITKTLAQVEPLLQGRGE